MSEIKGIVVLVCGGRHYNDPVILGAWLGGIMNQRGIARIIEGGASGADNLAKKFGEWKGIPVDTYRANWRQHGVGAGPLRNQRMLDEGRPDLVVAFPGGAGTFDMVRRARAAGIEVLEVTQRVTDDA